MTGAGNILLILAIGALWYFMIRKGGGSCGSSHDHDHRSDNDQTGGGCCG
jgi:hypothetical protein